MKTTTRIIRDLRTRLVLIALLLSSLVMLFNTVYLRVDLTAAKQFSLASSTVNLISSLEDRLQIKLYYNRDIEGHEYLLPQRLLLQDLLSEIEAIGGEYISVETVDPTSDLVANRDAEHIGVEPVPLTGEDIGSLSVDLLYQGLELRYQDRSEVIPFVIADEFEFAFSARLSSLISGQKPVIGIMSNESLLPPPMPGIPRQIPEDRIYELLRNTLGERYTIRDFSTSQKAELDLEGLSTLIVARPFQFPPHFVNAINEFLIAGNSVLLLYDPEFVEAQTLEQSSITTGLEDWLAKLGVKVKAEFVFDSNSIQVQAGAKEVETPSGPQVVPLQAPYGLGILAENDSLNLDHPVTSVLGSVAFFWAHSIDVDHLVEGLSATTLVSSSEQAWLLPADSNLDMSTSNIRDLQLKAYASSAPRSYPLVQLIGGKFHPQALQAGRLVVCGDSDLFHNLTLRSGADANREFAANLVDWLANDSDLITLRSRGRRLRPLHDFASSYVEQHGGLTDDEDQNRQLSKDAIVFAQSRQRLIAVTNILAPILLMLAAAIGHFSYRARKARKEANV
ncbi:MAG: GldG family protein [Planctomycetota bacterium]|jgi:ABC-type uncharacterized transport system involved in gliding motility auxiliary subunit|nr:GldG family protein [Planctomycetota bacterium]